MASSAVNSVTDRNIDQLLAFVDQTTAEVASLQNKFDTHDELVDAFGGDATANGFVAAQAKEDKIETRLIAAKARQEAAYNRYVATIESTNKIVVGTSKANASSAKAAAKVEDNKILKRKLREPDEWKDHAGKTHVKNLQAFTACKSMSAILWKLHDAFRLEAELAGGSAEEIAKDVALGELFTHNALMDRIDTMSTRELLDYALNMVHEQSVVVYLQHHYSHEVVAAFSGDKLYLVDQSLPTQERVDAAVKRVQKLTTASKAAIAPGGTKRDSAGGKKGGGKWKEKKAMQQLQQQQSQQQMFPPGFGSGFGQGSEGQWSTGRCSHHHLFHMRAPGPYRCELP